LIDIQKCANICALRALAVAQPETKRTKVAARLKREGWVERHGGDHDVFKHPSRPGRIVVPRHRTLSPGVARAIARQAGWQ
jgi:predicted RNA binding protein YcfA (HicA-like mRNA interferase family)